MANGNIDFTKTPLTELYGSNQFSESVMRQRLPKSVFKELQAVMKGEQTLTLEIAEVVASAMRDWAIEKGATHYTHWFQPMTGLTAEKHDSFISPTSDGKVIMEFSGKELIMGEPDASSFPSGGLRATFEARGYTAWDTTSPAFLKEDRTGVTLYIPTAFISFRGEALDKKVPLLRSMEAIEKQSLRILKILGNDSSKHVFTTVGPEQEYFLVDKSLYDKRPDLILAGRTLFGAMPAKGQELDDHYFGSIKERVSDFMRELNYELWKLGISAKTQHNEVAPNQFELATIFASANVATDNNQLVMDTLRKVALRHGLVVLLHEKPFAGVNGSGKHNNWSIATDDGINLLEPGDSPHENAQFLLFLAAVIEAVDRYAPLLRVSAANTGNDHRLGANEAPPAIISIFLGDQLSDILEAVSGGGTVKAREGEMMIIGQTSLPKFPKHMTDRNRTSPFAFTGNKFEFRMAASSASIAEINTFLNAAVADVLAGFAERLETAKDTDKTKTIAELVKESYNNHKRVVFNGNGYSDDWVAEAEKRGLPNIATTVEAIERLTDDSNIGVLSRHGILSKEEILSRHEIYLESYSKKINIEAEIMLRMARQSIYPAVNRYIAETAELIGRVGSIDSQLPMKRQREILAYLVEKAEELAAAADVLEVKVKSAQSIADPSKQARSYRFDVFVAMSTLRAAGDALEEALPRDAWPFPNYEELLFML
ncbi:glutamine synthetase III family protein [Sediminispirochaeta bajacaliforniensis]|uniref:glutamine synthetase III family protein n=1 Tax=Sediminispirochaeta bajacaliforniensis TaxID=148 RepID=UPI000373A514|nr:glutamine synthetase III [Sediminispirochaeta bajacaliforniensis]